MMSRSTRVHLAAHLPGVDNTVVWSDPRSRSQTEFETFENLARSAERGLFDFLFLAEGLRLREFNGKIYENDVVGRPDSLVYLAAISAVTSRLGLAATVNTTFNEPYDLARKLATLDHVSGGRAAWNVVTANDAFTGANFTRGGFLPDSARYERAREFLALTHDLWRSWSSGPLVPDPSRGWFTDSSSGAYSHRGQHFDVAGRFNVPTSPQTSPVIIQAGDSEEGRELAAETADIVFSKHTAPDTRTHVLPGHQESPRPVRPHSRESFGLHVRGSAEDHSDNTARSLLEFSLPRPSTKSTDPRIAPPREALAEHVGQSSFDRDGATVTVCTAAITRWLRAPDL